MIKYQKPLDLDTVREKIEERIEETEENFRLYEAILGVIRLNEGKKITKRIATAISKLLPEYTVYYSNDFFYSILIWGNGIPYDHKKDFLFSGYSKDLPCRESEFVHLNQWAALEPGRVVKMKEGLKQLDIFVDEWNKGLGCLQAVHDMAMEYGSTIGYTFDIQGK